MVQEKGIGKIDVMIYLRFIILCLILGILSNNVAKSQQNVETYL